MNEVFLTIPSPSCLVTRAQPPQSAYSVTVLVSAKNVQATCTGGGLRTVVVQVGSACGKGEQELFVSAKSSRRRVEIVHGCKRCPDSGNM